MLTSNNYNRVFLLAFLFVLNNLCFCMPWEFNTSLVETDGFSLAIATWYGNPNGPGSGGACGLGDDVANAPYYGVISAGNNNIFRSGAGCGTCYQVKCTENSACSGNPIVVTITDECPGACNNEPYHFDLSGKAFGLLAKPGQADTLRKAGRINIQYSRVRCNYKANIVFKVITGANPFYLAFVVENMNGDGEIRAIDISAAGRQWKPMQRVYGANWKYDVPGGETGPYSIKITDATSKSIVAYNVLPRNWAPGGTYYSSVNF